jgi:hypothetical protein
MAAPPRVEREDVLLARASAFPEFTRVEELNQSTLREITQREGIDFATALLYDRVRRAPQHARFIAEIDQWKPPRQKPAFGGLAVGIVPAAFYKENRSSGADGRIVSEEARRLGIHCELIPVSSAGTLAENSRTILNWLADHRAERIILVSLCKGGADIKFALSHTNGEEHFKCVDAWINICGTLSGSPVAKWLLTAKPRRFGVWLYCKCRGHDLAALREMADTSSTHFSAPLRLPATVRLISIVGFPLRRHLTNRFMRMCHERVSGDGPTDGGLLLADACHLPGVLYPVWGADHYLRPDAEARKIISAILDSLAPGDIQPVSARESETPAIDRT